MTSNYFTEVTLGEISKGNKGSYGIAASAVEYSNDLYTYLRITDITDDGTLNKDDLKSVDEENAGKYLLQPNDIVFARTGNSTGRSYFYDGTDGELVFAGFLIKFSLDSEKVNPKFMRYYTLSNEYRNWVTSFSTGSTRGNINAQTYANMKIHLPPREQQDYLVNLLSSLDKKIENNNKINKILEETAAAIFKHWFVDFEFPNENGEPYHSSGGDMVESELGLIPKGWKNGTLTEIGDLIMGQSPKGDTYNFEGNGLGLVNGASDFKNGEINPLKYTTDPKKVSKEGDWIFGVRATVGNVTYVDKEYCLGRGVGVVRSQEDIYREYLYFILVASIDYLEKTALGSVYINLTKTDFENIKVKIPDRRTIESFHIISGPIFKKINSLREENRKLTEIRDTLLPKLMSGEIRVPLED
ncbi:restriction endonuclease subunit S [Cytobacillus firmus]|uniref:restriction endonuclease subunit S n=1 Tax=Cytobacillus firmus TaxID=1399 RepID=UPI003BA2CEA5